MKILHVGKFFSPIEGGIESINKFIVDALTGNQQRVVSFNNNRSSLEEDIDNVPVIRASSLGIIASQPFSFSYFWELRRKIKQFQPDIVHLHYPNPLAALFLLFNKKTYKLIVHWHSDIVAQKNLYKFIKPIENIILRKADKIIATSPSYRDSSESLQKFKYKTVIIPCSIDEEKFKLKSEDIERIKNLKQSVNNIPIIFFIGRHVEYKGIKYLLEAEKYIKEKCVLVIAGRGPLTTELQKQYCSERIHWVGRLSDDEMKYYYHAAEIFAFPSITKNEAFGVVLAEAMSCETPAVTFSIDGSGVNWVAPNNVSAIEVENSNSEAYAAAIDLLLKDHKLRNTLACNGKRRTHELFSKETVEKQYIELYNKLYQS